MIAGPVSLMLLAAFSSHTDESESQPNHAPQGIYTPNALPATTLPILGVGDWTGTEYAGLHTLRLVYLNG